MKGSNKLLKAIAQQYLYSFAAALETGSMLLG
jgi:hypothetical protein